MPARAALAASTASERQQQPSLPFLIEAAAASSYEARLTT